MALDESEGYSDAEYNYTYRTIEYGYKKLTGFVYNGHHYTYLYNKNDIIVGIADEQGNQIVKYAYDGNGVPLATYSYENEAWIINKDPDFIGNKNKMLYTGMYYDENTGYYYVNQSYYDPVLKRYVDDIEDIETGTNNGIQLLSDQVLEHTIDQWTTDLLNDDSYGLPKEYSTDWYSSLSDVEVIARAIYCEGGTAYTSEQNAVAWVIRNRMVSAKFEEKKAVDIVKADGQFASITGGKDPTNDARVPDKRTTRWKNATYLACLLVTTTDVTIWKNMVGNTLNGQLYFYAYTYAKEKYDSNISSCVFSESGGALYYNKLKRLTIIN